jgi:hypothetical protein
MLTRVGRVPSCCYHLHDCNQRSRPASVDTEERAACHGPPFQHIYRRLFPIILLLATDVDSVATTLFRSLTLQLIHWFSESADINSAENDSLIDAIIGAICDASNSSLRTFGIECIAEFAKWSFRRSRAAMSTTTPSSIASLIRRLCSLCSHPCSEKRLGSCSAFGHLCRSLREHGPVESEHALDIISNLLRSVELSDRKSDFAFVEAADDTLKSYIRIIVHCRFVDRIQKMDPNRSGRFANSRSLNLSCSRS